MPRVVLAVPDAPQADMIQRVLRRLGWPVQRAATSDEVRAQLCESPYAVAILGIDLTDESGWLTCAKLTRPRGQTTVLIVGPDTPRNQMMARAAGASALLADPVEVADWLPPMSN